MMIIIILVFNLHRSNHDHRHHYQIINCHDDKAVTVTVIKLDLLKHVASSVLSFISNSTVTNIINTILPVFSVTN